jgi:hypothetical protein
MADLVNKVLKEMYGGEISLLFRNE